MRLLIISSSGSTRAIQIHRRHFFAWVLLAAASLVVAGWSLPTHFAELRGLAGFESLALDRWRSGLLEDAQQLQELRSQFVAETEAQGKLLARMEARLLRMEAFGARMVESAALDPAEFNFGNDPAVGGPLTPEEGQPNLDLVTEIERLAARLRSREAEFEILENVLASRELLAEQLPSGSPVNRGWISSPYGRRVDPIHGQQAFHAGVDFVGKAGSPVVAAGAGVVTWAGDKDEYGQTVEISHGQGLVTRYGHHQALKVQVGDIVRRGDVIGLMGSTGRATGYHVHFEVEKDGKHVNPIEFLRNGKS